MPTIRLAFFKVKNSESRVSNFTDISKVKNPESTVSYLSQKHDCDQPKVQVITVNELSGVPMKIVLVMCTSTNSPNNNGLLTTIKEIYISRISFSEVFANLACSTHRLIFSFFSTPIRIYYHLCMCVGNNFIWVSSLSLYVCVCLFRQ